MQYMYVYILRLTTDQVYKPISELRLSKYIFNIILRN